MKKRLLFFVFAAIAGTLTALADDYIWVSGKEMPFNSSWSHDYTYFKDSSRGTVSWNASTHTLTLDNFKTWRGWELNLHTSRDCINIESKQDITIEVKGNCELSTLEGQTLALHGNTTFTGDGKLLLSDYDDAKPCINLKEKNLTVTLNGPSLKLDSKNDGIRGVSNTGTFHMKAGYVEGQVKGKIVKDLSSVLFNYGMGVKKNHGAMFNLSRHCMVDKDGNEITGKGSIDFGPIEYYGFAINGTDITENNYDLISTFNSVQSGQVKYDPIDNELSLYEVTLCNPSIYPTIDNHSNKGLTIGFRGTCRFTFEGDREREAMRLRENTTLLCNAWSNTHTSLNIDESFAGIYVRPNKKLTVKSHTDDGFFLNVPWIEGGNRNSELILSDYIRINASGSSEGTVRSINVVNQSHYPEVAVGSKGAIYDEPRFIWNAARVPGVYESQEQLATGSVTLSTEYGLEWYDIYICDHQVNSLNMNRIVNEYFVSGYCYYRPGNNTLTMVGAKIEYNGISSNPLIRWTSNSFSEYKIRVTDDTSIYNKNGNKTIYSPKNLEILGVGSFDISGDLDVKGELAVRRFISLYAADNVTVSSIYIDNSQFYADQMKNYQDGSSSVPATLNEVIVQNDIDDLSSTSFSYYDSETKKLVCNGHVRAIPSFGLTQIEGVKFCGQELYDGYTTANKSIKRGYLLPGIYEEDGNLAVDIYMDYGFQCDNDSRYPVFEINNPKIKKVRLYTGIGDIEFWCRQGSPFITSNVEETVILTNFDVESSLTVHGEGGPSADGRPGGGEIIVPANGKLIIGDKDDENTQEVYLPRIVGQGTSSKLIIYDPYLTVGANESGSVANISVELPTGRAELDCRDDLVRIGNDGIYLEDQFYTGQVKFVKKGEGYIPVDEVHVDIHELKFDAKGQTAQLRATVLPDNATNKKVFWRSADEKVAKVDQNGKVTVVGKGLTMVAAISEEMENPNSFLSACLVTVEFPKPTAVTLSETDVLIDRESVGGFYLTANLTPSNAETEYTWESSDETLVQVIPGSGKSALVRRVGDEGQATITVKTANGLSASCNVTVHYPITPQTVEFAKRTYTLTEVGEQLKLEPIVTPENCEKLSFTWSLHGGAISLTSDGTVTALRNGSAVVECWACYDGQQWAPGEVRINVEIPATPVIATGLKLSPSSSSPFYSLGERLIMTPDFTPEDVTNQQLVWYSTNESVATVDENGIVTIVGWGDCEITATTTDGSRITARQSITAIDPSTLPEPVYATGISITEKEVTLMRGEEARIGVTIEPANYTENVMMEPLEGDISIAEVREEWDWSTNQTSIYIRSQEWSEQFGDMKWVIRPSAVDWEKLNAMGIWEEPRDTITIHVLAPIIFAEASPEDINITYHVTDINDKTCEVYPIYNEWASEPDPDLAGAPLVTPAVDVTATGKLTVPARANGYWVTAVKERAFQKCSGLTDIEFSEGIETIGDEACYRRLFSLERVTLPSTIKELGYYCFSAHTSDYVTSGHPSGRNFIREVNIKSFTPPTGQNGNDISMTGAFQSVAADAVLFVPTGALANYNVQPWTEWFSRIEEKAFFEDEDAIREVESSKLKVQSSWFDLSGRKLAGKPTKAGLYINGGKKIVISKP